MVVSLLLAPSLVPSPLVAETKRPADWPTYLHDVHRTCRQPVPGALATAPKIVAAYPLGSTPRTLTTYFDRENDGVTEGLLLIQGSYTAQSYQGKTLWTSDSFDRPQLIAFEDLDGDGTKEFLFSAFPPQLAVVSAQTGRTLARLPLRDDATRTNASLLDQLEPDRKGLQYFVYGMIEKPGGKNSAWAFYVVFDDGVEKARIAWSRDLHLRNYPIVFSGDADGDGRRDLVAQSHSELTVMDPRTGNTIAHLDYVGGRRNYGVLEMLNVDDDPDEEIIVLADRMYPHMEVLKLGTHPHLQWYRSFQRENETTSPKVKLRALPNSVGDLDGDAQLEIAYSLWNDRRDGQWHVRVVDARHGDLELDLAGYCLRAVEDLDGDGAGELFASPEVPGTSGIDENAYTLRLFNLIDGRASLLGEISSTGKLATVGHESALNQAGAKGRPRLRTSDVDENKVLEFSWQSGGKETTYSLDKTGRLVVASPKPAKRKPATPAPPPNPPPSTPLGERVLPRLGNRSTLLAANVMGDARPELLVEQDRALVALSCSDGEMKEVWRYAGIARCGWNQEWYPATALDIDGDGRYEVVVGLAESGKQIHQLGLLSSEGKLLRTLDFPETTQSEDKVRAWAEGDFNGDGLPELTAFVWRHAPSGYDAIALDPKTGKRLWKRTMLQGVDFGGNDGGDWEIVGPVQPVVTARDLNGDGADDLILGSLAFNYVALDGRTGEIQEAFHIANVFETKATGYGYPITTDLDGDGRLEVVMEYAGGQGGAPGAFRLDASLPYPQRKLWMEMYITHDGMYMDPRPHPAFGISDVDGDGRAEVLIPRRSGGGLLECHDGISGKVEWRHNVGSRTTDILPWDVNGDGRVEFVFGSRGGRVSALQGDGTPLWDFEVPRDLGGQVDWLIVADVLGRGRPQLAVSANGHVYVLGESQ